MKIKHYINSVILKNKLRVVHVYIPDFPIAISSFWVNAGSRFDPVNKEGLAHFFEHILTTRTKKYPNRNSRLIEIEKQGFLFNAHTGLETVNYHISHDPELTDSAIELLIDGYENSIFLEKDIEEEKQIIVDEERRSKNNPKSYIWRLANTGIWPNSMLGSKFFGNKESILKINSTDIENFYRNFYQTSNSAFLLINSIKDVSHILKNIEDVDCQKSKISIQEDNLGKKKDIVFEKRDIDYSQISCSFITTNYRNEEDAIVLDIIKNYLASGWISRLITCARIENKLTYWVDSASEQFGDTGYIRFFSSINRNHTQEFLNIFEEEIKLLKSIKIKNSVLNNHKSKYISDLLRLSLNTDYLNLYYGTKTISSNNTPLLLQDKIDKILNTSPSQILQVANKYLNKANFSLAIIGQTQEVNNIPNF